MSPAGATGSPASACDTSRTATAVVPREVIDHRGRGLLEIEWDDGGTSRLPHAWLRARCRCAFCARAARAGAMPALAAVSLTEIRPISDQGLNLVFSDGHGRGIYPWAYLRALGDEQAASVPSG